MPDNTMVSFRTCLSSEVDNKSIINGSFILCSDSGEAYYDNLEGERILIAQNIEYLNSDSERTSMLTPETNKLYIIISTGMLWIYSSGWICLNAKTTTYFDIDNIEVPTGSSGIIIEDSRISADCLATFSPINALYDLATAEGINTTCNCNNGSVTVITNCDYPLIGKIKIIKP